MSMWPHSRFKLCSGLVEAWQTAKKTDNLEPKRRKDRFSDKKLRKIIAIFNELPYLCNTFEKDGPVAQLDRATAF